MAKTRMAEWMREKLREHAKKVVQPAKERALLDAAYRTALPLVRALVHARYPARDMKVLDRYGVAEDVAEVKVQAADGSVERFEFQKDDRPKRPSSYSTQGFYLVDDAVASAVSDWASANKAYHEERSSRLNAYGALILASTNVEDLVELWPEAAGVIPKANLPLAFSPEQIATVKRDLQERAAA